jgi:hypothetical protein
MTDDDQPITLEEACRLYPGASVTVSALRAAAGRGDLLTFLLGRRSHTTRASMHEWVLKCQERKRRRAYTSTRAESSGLSETDRASSARAALKSDTRQAEIELAAYLGHKHKPEGGPDPLIADVLLAYSQEVLPHTKAKANAAYNVANLAATGWGSKRVSAIRKLAELMRRGARPQLDARS